MQVPSIPLPASRGARGNKAGSPSPLIEGRGMPGTCTRLMRRCDNPIGAALEHQVPGWVRGHAHRPKVDEFGKQELQLSERWVAGEARAVSLW